MSNNLFLSHRVYNAYHAHRLRSRSNSPGGGKRLYPSFRTSGSKIVPPLDVPSSACPIFNNETLRWVGKEVTQYRRPDFDYYVGTFFSIC